MEIVGITSEKDREEEIGRADEYREKAQSVLLTIGYALATCTLQKIFPHQEPGTAPSPAPTACDKETEDKIPYTIKVKTSQDIYSISMVTQSIGQHFRIPLNHPYNILSNVEKFNYLQ